MVSDAKRKTNMDYDRKNTKLIGMKLNRNTDKDILEHLENQENIQGYLKQLIRQDIEGGIRMNSNFYDRVIREQIVDTKKYRYIAKECHGVDEQWIEIQRLPIESLDTTAAIDGWETVKIIK